MPRCFITGVEIGIENAHALDVSEAHRVVRELKNKLQALEQLIEQLGACDTVTVRDRNTGKPFIRRDYRLVSATMAQALGQTCSERRLFLPFAEWRQLRRSRVRSLPQGLTGTSPAGDAGTEEGTSNPAASAPSAETEPRAG